MCAPLGKWSGIMATWEGKNGHVVSYVSHGNFGSTGMILSFENIDWRQRRLLIDVCTIWKNGYVTVKRDR